MPKLVAFYLREFSVKSNGEPSLLYKFIFCLCLPFVSQTFRRARLNALAIAECTNSGDQIKRVIEKLTGVTFNIVNLGAEYLTAFDGSDDVSDFPFNNSSGSDNAIVPFAPESNNIVIYITLNGASKSTVEAYLPLLIPFYVKIDINYI